MNLVIVESPTKGNTISKFLGNNYKVMSSYGHIRDLPRSKLGVDTEHDFEVQYLIPKRAKPNAKALEEAASKSATQQRATQSASVPESLLGDFDAGI